MKIVGARRPGSKNISRVREISREAKAAAEGDGPLRSPRQCGIDLSLLRYQPSDILPVEGTVQLQGPEELGREEPQAQRLRKPTWSRELALAVLHLREQYPAGERQAGGNATGPRLAGVHLYGRRILSS